MLLGAVVCVCLFGNWNHYDASLPFWRGGFEDLRCMKYKVYTNDMGHVTRKNLYRED